MVRQSWGRRRSDNQAYPKGNPDKGDLPQTMFGKPKYKKYSDIIKMDTPANAEMSVKTLNREFDGAKTRAKKLRIARATRLAANRADAMLKRKDLSTKEQREFYKIRKIYADTANEMFLDYGEGNPGERKMDGSGRGVSANVGRGGCVPPKRKGISR